MKLNTVYTTFNGEVNAFGIGSPAIFLRLQGCHLRCYKKTLGSLCDTPEGLENPKKHDSIESIVKKVTLEAAKTNIKLITLTGGDPLNNDYDELVELFKSLKSFGFHISIETSGTLAWDKYMVGLTSHLTWVIDYKLKSAGVKNAILQFNNYTLALLTERDYIKFVIYDSLDLNEAIETVKIFSRKTRAKLAVGAYWGGKIEPFEVFTAFKEEGLLGVVTMNFQVHKMALASRYDREFPKEI